MDLDLLWHRVKVITLFLQYCYSIMVPEVPEVAQEPAIRTVSAVAVITLPTRFAR